MGLAESHVGQSTGLVDRVQGSPVPGQSRELSMAVPRSLIVAFGSPDLASS